MGSCSTRYPILLLHGMNFGDRLPLHRYWGRIPEELRQRGAVIYISTHDGNATIQENALNLVPLIRRILRETGAEKVNIIAHSKGGLDAKYMIQNLGMADRVASLTTLCTPFKGSPIASFILRFPEFAVRYAAWWVNLAYRILGDRAPDSFTACQEMRRVTDENTETLNCAGPVFCQSFSSAVRKGEKGQDFVMSIPLAFSRWLEKNRITDGMVPKDSAIFGNYRGDCVDGSISHTEIVDFMVADKKRDKIYAFYSALCEELVNAGY